ncbi:MAG: hypothetical protein AAGI71_04090 [Bacteroidota bacterium]
MPRLSVQAQIRWVRVMTPILFLVVGSGLFLYAERTDDPDQPRPISVRTPNPAEEGTMPADAFQESVITRFGLLVDGTPPTLLDRPVALNDVQIDGALGDSTFWLIGDNQERLFVVVDDPEALRRTVRAAGLASAALNLLETVDLTGRVREAPDWLGTWDLNRVDRERLEKRTFYLRAETVTP